MKKISPNTRIGESFTHPKFGIFTIVNYENCEKVTVEFNDTKFRQVTSYSHIRNLEVFDPLHCGVYGTYKGSNIRNKAAYKCWYNMIHRVHNCKAYENVCICDEWYDFSNFESWYSHQYKERGWHLDKDLKNKGNREYNSANCCFLPAQINTFISKFTKSKGYSFNKNRGRYEAYCREDGKYIHLGMYDTSEDARSAYLSYKIKVAYSLIDKYKETLAIELQQAIIKYIKDE